MKRKVLVTGGGQLARALLHSHPAGLTLEVLDIDRLDITDRAQVLACVAELEPELIVNAAAYTAVDRAEEEETLAWAVNAEGPRHLAEAALAHGARLVQISTDYVFDGRKGEPYLPLDRPNPLSAYGRTKLGGERAVVEVLDEAALVVRTAWLYDEVGPNFLKTMLRLMAERDEVRVVDDQFGTPTWAATLAKSIWILSELGACGTMHVTDAGAASWHEFAVAIRDGAQARKLIGEVDVQPVSDEAFPTKAQRPAYAVLDKTRTEAMLGEQLPSWQASLERCLDLVALGERT
jgi:dTDP-4-dehydrorhamnose reductase